MDDITVVVAAYVRNEAIYWIVSKLLMPTTEAEDFQPQLVRGRRYAAKDLSS